MTPGATASKRSEARVSKPQEPNVWMNGKLLPQSQATVSVFDHGLLYGDGVFEGIRMYNGKVFKHKEHMDRLYNSARFLMIDIPYTKKDLMKAVEDTCQANGLVNGYVRLVVTRGLGDLGIDPKKCKSGPTVFIIAATIQLYPAEFYEKGIKVVTAATPRNAGEALNPRVKSLNYLNNILAKIEGNNAGALEVVMINANGTVCEGSADNLFIVRNKVLLTPPPTDGILEGITRATIMELARKAGYEVREQSLQRYDLYTCDEFFMCGTGAELIPVIACDARVIADGKPGPVFNDLLARFRKLAMG